MRSAITSSLGWANDVQVLDKTVLGHYMPHKPNITFNIPSVRNQQCAVGLV